MRRDLDRADDDLLVEGRDDLAQLGGAETVGVAERVHLRQGEIPAELGHGGVLWAPFVDVGEEELFGRGHGAHKGRQNA